MTDDTPRHNKPAEVYLTDDTMIRADNVVKNSNYLLVWEQGDRYPTYYPHRRVHKVRRLPHPNEQRADTEATETPSQANESYTDVTQDSDDEGDSEPDTAAVKAWLDELGIPTGEFEVTVHEEYGSINVSPNGQVEWWGDVTGELRDADNAWWDGDDRVWIIQDPEEVVG